MLAQKLGFTNYINILYDIHNFAFCFTLIAKHLIKKDFFLQISFHQPSAKLTLECPHCHFIFINVFLTANPANPNLLHSMKRRENGNRQKSEVLVVAWIISPIAQLHSLKYSFHYQLSILYFSLNIYSKIRFNWTSYDAIYIQLTTNGPCTSVPTTS